MNDDVSRETPPTPDVAAGVFGDALPSAERFAALLAHDGVVRGLVGPRETTRLWDRHLLNCALLGDAIEGGVEVCDIGSGAGLPGVVLALTRPDVHVTLVEPLLRRTTFLDEVVGALGLTNVEVVRARAEQLHGDRDFDIVTSRAVAPLDRLLAWSMPLVRLGGALVAMKGAAAQAEVVSAHAALTAYGAGTVSIESYGAGIVDPPTTVVRVPATGPSHRERRPTRTSGPAAGPAAGRGHRRRKER